VAELIPMAVVEDLAAVPNREGFAATWRAHRTQAVRACDLALVGAASALVYAADRGANLISARITLGNHTWAGWIDVEAGALVALVRPAERYLDPK
jgi:hypothetical protein